MRDTEQTNLKQSDNAPQEPQARSYGDFFNYFGQDRWVHSWFAEKRTKILSSLVEPFRRLGLAPDTISYTGIAFLAGVFLYFVRKPSLAVVFLAGHIICDALDGVFARRTGKASQSGAFTDLVCDQLGMLVVAMAAVFHHLVAPVLGAAYMVLYLIVVGFGVIINAMGLGTRVTITSKYFLYIVYAIWAGWQVNLFTALMTFFSVIMAMEVVIGYIRLKAGIRRKYDSAVKFDEGSTYSSKLNYALNLAVPLGVLAGIIICGNLIPIRAMMDKPSLKVEWRDGGRLISSEENQQILGLGVNGEAFLALLRDEARFLEIRRIIPTDPNRGESFLVPSYVSPVISTFPVYDNVILIADNTTRLVLGIDLKASFAAKRAVIIFTVPMGYLHVTAMTEGEWNGKTVWLAANYLYTRKTCVIDPDKALNKGSLLGGVVACYTNAGFPSGMTYTQGTVMEFNKSPLAELIYAAPINRLVRGPNLLDAQHVSFAPPERDLFGPFHHGDDLVMVSSQGKLFRVTLNKILRQSGLSPNSLR